MHPYFDNAGEHFIVCTAVVNCPAAAVTKKAIALIGCTGESLLAE